MTDTAIPFQKQPVRHKWTWVEMLISSLISLTASLVLSIDAWVLAANPDATLSCNISSTISCGTVAQSWQAKLLGFPNAFLGLIAEPVVLTVVIASLGGVLFPRWFMRTALAIYSIGFVFAYWLFYQAYFEIGALCPWCLLVTLSTTTVFITMLRVSILDNHIRFPGNLHEKVVRGLRLGADTGVAAILIALIVSAVISKYY